LKWQRQPPGHPRVDVNGYLRNHVQAFADPAVREADMLIPAF
jgi:hypothetical protein